LKKNLELLPGLFVKVRLQLGVQEVILVPQRATNRNPDGELTVWVVNKEGKDEKASQVVIKSSRSIGNQWVISSGLKEGDRIIYKGFQVLKSGMKVNVKHEGGG
jgi:membrane fusion protein (multidrug efflux system)